MTIPRNWEDAPVTAISSLCVRLSFSGFPCGAGYLVLLALLAVKSERGENREGARLEAHLLDLGGMSAVLLVEVGAADRAEPLSIRLAEHHEGRLHDQRRQERAREVDGVVGRDEREV